MMMSCSSSSVTSAVAVGGTRAYTEDADGPGVDVGTGGGGEVAEGKNVEAAISRSITPALYLLPSAPRPAPPPDHAAAAAGC